MLLLAAASLAATLSLDVPYMPQTEVLCGGAAAAMVFRYWGDAHAGVEQFAPLVNRRAGGIAGDRLARAIRDGGWHADQFAGSMELLRGELARRHPLVILVADRGARYHYLVVTGASPDDVVVHDPSWGPSRQISVAALDRVWRPTGYWTLLIQPGEQPSAAAGSAAASHDAVENVTENAELAGIRFVERRWSDAALLAEQAVARNEGDRYASDMLASSRFMLDDQAGAIRAWNHIERPRVDTVRIQGLRRARYQSIAEALGISTAGVLSADAFELARRRLAALPDVARSRISLTPDADGYGALDVAVVERAVLPQSPFEWAALGARSAVDRELILNVPGPNGQGELWSASWRWWEHRPRVSLGFAAPYSSRLRGIWRVEGSWESQGFLSDAATIDEQRLHGALSAGDWLTPNLHYTWTAGVDSWRGPTSARAVSLGAELERRALANRLSLAASGTRWWAWDGGAPFHALSARARFQSSAAASGWVVLGELGAERVSHHAPLGLWPGAGEGHRDAALLRAHPLLDAGIVRAADGAFSRTLVNLTAEMQHWTRSPSSFPVRFGIAAFADAAQASRGAAMADRSPLQVDVGVGLRVHIPGAGGALRIDVARGFRDGAQAFTAGWQFW